MAPLHVLQPLPHRLRPGIGMAFLSDITLGIDFGTSNSAMAARRVGGPVQPIALEGSALTMPTALFFNSEERQSTHFGRDAMAHYLAGNEGRLMR